MAKHKIIEDLFDTWTIDGDSKTWLLEEDASITVNGAPAIDILSTSVDNTLDILGDIVASGDGGQGILVSGANTRIDIGKQAEIDADEGIHSTAGGLRVVNKGEIDGLHYGVSSSTSASVKNLGDISGDLGISTLGTSKVVNGADGTIQGDAVGVFMGFGSDGVLINHGMISGNGHAVRLMGGGENRLINTGTIHGDIEFGIGNDLLDSRNGIIVGSVAGGDGDDVYKAGKNDITLIEDVDGGIDTVFSDFSHILADNFENVFLRGQNSNFATGNGENNVIHGNKGGNTLNGREGDDEIAGGKGDDILVGEDGSDTFIFNRGGDHDLITDFIKGEDIVQLGGFDGVSSFEELQFEMFKNGNDVWIQLGGGDRLIIQNTDVADLDASDFSFIA